MVSKSKTSVATKKASRQKTQISAITLLKKDHATVKGLLKKLASAQAVKQRKELLTKIAHEVKIHTQIEEEIFYPAFRDAVRAKKDKNLYFEALEEHHVVDMVLPKIKSISPSDKTFSAKAKVLKDLIEHHAGEEEKQMFPKAKKVMNTSELQELGLQLNERKEQLKQKLNKK